MKIVASQSTAAVTGIWAGVVCVVLGPLVDRDGPWSSLSLVASVLLISIPAFFFVFGIGRKDMVGLWMFKEELLKREFVFLGGVISVGLLALLAHLLT